MSPARNGESLDLGAIVGVFDYSVIGDRAVGIGGIGRADLTDYNARGSPVKMLVDYSHFLAVVECDLGGGIKPPFKQCYVGFFYSFGFHMLGHFSRGDLVFGNDHKSACVSVESVYGTENKGNAAALIVVSESICKRIIVMPVRGVRGHKRRLVYYDNVPVLVYYIQRKLCRGGGLRRFGVVKSERKDVAALQHVSDGHAVSANENAVFLVFKIFNHF